MQCSSSSGVNQDIDNADRSRYNRPIMRMWRNWYTRTFEGRVRKGEGSSPSIRTI